MVLFNYIQNLSWLLLGLLLLLIFLILISSIRIIFFSSKIQKGDKSLMLATIILGSIFFVTLFLYMFIAKPTTILAYYNTFKMIVYVVVIVIMIPIFYVLLKSMSKK